MSTGINAQTGPDNQPPTFTFAPSGAQLDWPHLLRAWAGVVACQQPDAAGAWICTTLHHAADEAVVWGCPGPAEHDRQLEARERMDQAYLHELECRAHAAAAEPEVDDEHDPVTGSLIGPDEEHYMRGWIAPNDDLIN